MTELKIRDIFKDFESVELFYIKVDQDGNESIWRKCTTVTNDDEKVLCDRFYHDASFRPELDTYEKIHAYLVDFLHKIEEHRKQDIDEDDFIVITFFDSDPSKLNTAAPVVDRKHFMVKVIRAMKGFATNKEVKEEFCYLENHFDKDVFKNPMAEMIFNIREWVNHNFSDNDPEFIILERLEKEGLTAIFKTNY